MAVPNVVQNNMASNNTLDGNVWLTGNKRYPPFEDDNELLIAVSAAVFGFPALVIAIICLLRVRVAYLDKQAKALGSQSAEESVMLVTEDGATKLTPVQCVTNLGTANESDGEADNVTGNSGRKCRIRFADEQSNVSVQLLNPDVHATKCETTVKKSDGILKTTKFAVPPEPEIIDPGNTNL